MLMMESSLQGEFREKCMGDDFALFNLCWDQARSKSFLPIWAYLCPFMPGALAFWGKWVWQPSTSNSSGIFHKRFMWWIEAVLIFLGVVAVLLSLYALFDKKPSNITFEGTFNAAFVGLGMIGGPWIASILLERDAQDKGYRRVIWALRLIIAAPIIGIAIGFGRYYM